MVRRKRAVLGRVSTVAVGLSVILTATCQRENDELAGDVPLHLEEHLDAANVVGSEVPQDIREPVIWNFDQPQPDWQPIMPLASPAASVKPATVTRTEQGLQIRLGAANDFTEPSGRPRIGGGVFVQLPDWRREDWSEILVRARTSDKVEFMSVGFRIREKLGSEPWERFPFKFSSGMPVIRDGSMQTYTLRADWSMDYSEQWEGPWRQLGVMFWSREPVTVELLSVSVIPKEAVYSGAKVGIRTENRNQANRRTLYTHTPATIEYRVRIPQSGRLDLGLGVLRSDMPVRFRISAEPQGQAEMTLLEESYSDIEHWAQRTVDLSSIGGQAVTLRLQAEAERQGTVALWAAPTVSGTRRSKRPNVIFYIIDGAGADYMSVYGYNRRTTPNLGRLAAEGALFESAYSNSSWTRPSTASFLSSLHHSAMGGMRNNRVAPPKELLTIPEQLHKAGYQTAFFTSNPNAATMSNLDRGVDVLREKSVEPTSHSTRELHTDYWDWRHDYPGQPYWVHFQTTDVHWPHNPPTPFSGLFVTPERRKVLDQWEEKLKATTLWRGPWGDAFEKAGVDRVAFYTGKRDLYTEGMAHQDHQIGRLVARLKASGEWENTLLIIAADHGVQAGSEDYDIAVMDDLPPEWGPSFRPGITRIPMIFIWPGKIPAGQRIQGPASMIDMLPTILDLLDLPRPEVMQGRSLAPFLLQEADWEPSSIIFDEFYVNATSGKLMGSIEVVDGRWGASLEIVQEPEDDDRLPERRRPVPLLLYDLWNDPLCLRSLHEQRPDLVEKYTAFLEEQFEAHQALAQRFTRGEDSPLNPEQLETLRELGYIQ